MENFSENVFEEKKENDLQLAFFSAMSLLSVSPTLDCSYKNFSSLKATAKLEKNTLIARVSEGYNAASQDVLVGLALHLLQKIFRKKCPFDFYARAYKEFVTRESTARLNTSIRVAKPKKLEAVGNVYNLNDILAAVLRDYSHLLGTTKLSGISWNNRLGKRLLAFHDESFNTVMVNNSFDSYKVPQFVLEYLVFHELLHAKHGAAYQRGSSLRRMVHTHAFKQDEKKFLLLKEAESWLDSHWGRLSVR